MKIIKLKESELKQLIRESLLKEETDQEKELALIHFLNDEQDIEAGLANTVKSKYSLYGLDTYDVRDEETTEWLIGTEDEVDDAFEKYMSEMIDEHGFVGWRRGFVEQYIKSDWFVDFLRESTESYVYDIENESAGSDEYKNRQEEEMSDWDVDDPEELIEKMIEDAGDPIDHYKMNFGEEEFSEVVKRYDLYDEDAIIQGVKESDGRGTISQYDGVEHEYNFNGEWYYIYRTG
ncbi:hypothetical protein COB55_03445 [Candidatus Wolfebacteria bacterium]|nr:MAG: hypothetical protein COB55_03445 [Candidatus Wolfebacteria bacterium]